MNERLVRAFDSAALRWLRVTGRPLLVRCAPEAEWAGLCEWSGRQARMTALPQGRGWTQCVPADGGTWNSAEIHRAIVERRAYWGNEISVAHDHDPMEAMRWAQRRLGPTCSAVVLRESVDVPKLLVCHECDKQLLPGQAYAAHGDAWCQKHWVEHCGGVVVT